MRYFYKTTEEHHVTSESEAIKLIEEAKQDNRFQLLKSTTDYKTIKVKGEIEGEYWIVKLTKQFTDAKYPDCNVKVEYIIDNGTFPEPRNVESNYNEGDFEEDEDDDESMY